MTPDKTVLVCVPIRQETLSGLETIARVAESSADLMELRLDYLNADETEDLGDKLATLLPGLTCPAIITLRPAEEGGYRDLSDELRVGFWKSQALNSKARWWDIEAAFLDQLPFAPDWSRIICSHRLRVCSRS